MQVAVACIGFWSSVCTRRVSAAATIGSQAVVNQRAVLVIVTWRKVMCVAVTCIGLRSSISASRICATDAVSSQAVVDRRAVCLSIGWREVMYIAVACISSGPEYVHVESVPQPPSAVKQLLIGAQSLWLLLGEK